MVYLSALIMSALVFGQGDPSSSQRGLQNLTQTGESGVTLLALTSPKVFTTIWKVWPNKKLVQKLSQSSTEKRRKAVFLRYGFHVNPYDAELPLGFTRTASGQVKMNCLGCHAGQVLGKTVIGLPNRHIDFRGFVLDLKKHLPGRTAMMEKFANVMGPERGVLSALGIESAALDYRNADMGLILKSNNFGWFEDASANAPAWWNVRYKTHMFADATIPMEPRFLVTAAGDLMAGKKSYKKQDEHLKDIFSFMNTLTPPRYPGKIDSFLAEKGQKVFENKCSKCHGHYDSSGNLSEYPNKIIPADRVGTDPTRVFIKDTEKLYDFLKNSWIAQRSRDQFLPQKGYIAPPLKGIWATAPYLHNGSVPTLAAMLDSRLRPVIWQVSSNPDDYDLENVGLVYSVLEELSPAETDPEVRSRTYDSRKKGRSAQGHTFPDELDPEERKSVLEFLKTL